MSDTQDKLDVFDLPGGRISDLAPRSRSEIAAGFGAPPLCPPGEHDFGSGNAPCTKCLRDMQTAAVQTGADTKNVTPGDRVKLVPVKRAGGKRIVRGVGWNRADEVALPYGLERRPGEDDDSLHTRVRAIVASGKVKWVQPPPMDWTLPRNALPAPGAVQTYDMETDDL